MLNCVVEIQEIKNAVTVDHISLVEIQEERNVVEIGEEEFSIEIKEEKETVEVSEAVEQVEITEEPENEVVVLEGIYIIGGLPGNEFSEIRLIPKPSSQSGLEGTMFYCSEDHKVWVLSDC